MLSEYFNFDRNLNFLFVFNLRVFSAFIWRNQKLSISDTTELKNDKQSVTTSFDFVTKIFLVTPFKTNSNALSGQLLFVPAVSSFSTAKTGIDFIVVDDSRGGVPDAAPKTFNDQPEPETMFVLVAVVRFRDCFMWS